MVWYRKYAISLLGLGLGLLLAPCARPSGTTGTFVAREDRAWKHYANPRAGYCVSYPRRWRHGDAFDGAGLYAAVSRKDSTFPIAAMDISAFADAPPAYSAVSLKSDVEAHLDGLRRFVRAQQTEVLEQHSFSMSGNEGLFLKARYFDPRERSQWVEEVIFARRNGTLYRLELQTRETFLPRFEPVFAHFANSFAFECHGKH